MACDGVLNPPAKVTPQIGNLTPSQSSNFCSPPPLQLEMAASEFFTHGYFQKAHVHISEAIITD